MLVYEQMQQQTLQVFQAAITFAQERKNKEIERFLKETMERLIAGKLMVVVCGEFKQGKSSFINALLNEPNLCPVDIDITTSLVSTISYNVEEKISVLLGEPGQEAKQEKILRSRDEIADYVTEQRNPHNARRARILTIQIPNEQLKSGLVMVDTPGVGGLNSEHTDVAYAFIPNADVVLFISDALEPLSAVEIRFITERIARSCPNTLFIVTKKDKNARYQTVVEDNRQKLAVALNRSANDIAIIPVSNLAKRDYLESHDDEDLKESNFLALEEQLWRYLNEGRGRILLVKAATTLGRSISELRLPIQTELDACREQDQQRLDEMERQGREARQRLQNLLEHNAQWQTQLRDGLEDIQSRTGEHFQNGFGQIKQAINHYLEDNRLGEHPEQVVGLLQADMSVLMTALQRYISNEAEELQGKIEDVTDLNLNPYQTRSLMVIENTPPTPVSREKIGLWQKSIEVARGGAASGTGGAMVLGLLGGIVGGALGLLSGGALVVPFASWGVGIGASLGQLAGIVTGAKRTLRQMSMKEKSEIASYLLTFVQEQEIALSKSLRNSIKDLGRFMRDDLTAHLTREKKSIEEALRGLQDARKLTQDQAAARIATLTALIYRLNSMQQSIEQVVRSIMQPQEETFRYNTDGAQPKKETDFRSWADE